MASTAPSNATLTPPAGYTPPGVYIGQEYTSTSSVAPEVRVATYIGKGSRYTRNLNQQILRGYIYDAQLTFSTTAPHYAALAVPSNGVQGTDTLVDGNGNVVRQDLWLFANSGTAVQISDSVYDPTQTYFFSYQGSSYTTPDPLPVSDIRVIEAVGNQVSQNSYKRNVDYYIDEEILAPVPAMNNGVIVQHTNAVPVFSAITHTGTGSAVVAFDSSNSYQHNYSRSYLLTVTVVSGAIVTFSWTATPTSFGNSTEPAVPFAPSIAAPTFQITTTNAQTLTQALELGIRIDFSSTGTYVLNDTYAFTVTGPSLIEVDGAYSNSNQFASASSVVPSTSNTGSGTLLVSGANFSGLQNVNFVMQVTNVDVGVTAAAVPAGTALFSGNPGNGESITLTNGYVGVSNVTKTFEFDVTGVGQVIPGSVGVVSSTVAAVAATATIYFNGSITQTPPDGDTVTITDGVKTVVFEFDSNGVLNNPTAVKVIVDTTANQQSENTAANLVTAINANFTTLVATNVSGSHSNIGYVTLAMNVAGTSGNNLIVTSDPTFIKISGFSGGLNVTPNVSGTVANFIAAVNTTNPRLGLVAYQDPNNPLQVDLVYGSQFVFSGIPANSDTAVVTVGGVATTFEFQTTVSVSHGVLIGISVAATMSNFVTVINAVTGLVAAASTAGGINTVTVASTLHRSLVLTHPIGTAISSVVGDVIVGSASNNGNNAITSTGLSNGSITNVAYTGFVGGVLAGSAPDVLTLAWGTSGDVFTGGTLYVKDTSAGSAIVPLYQGVTVQTMALATAATGSITLNVNPANSDTITINDHVISAVTFTFKTTATLTDDVQIAATPALTAANLLAKIQLVGLSLTGSVNGSTVSLKANLTGSTYNGGITFASTALSVVNMAGGATNYGVGDTFSFTAQTPRKFVTALDTRTVRLTTGVVGENTSSLVDPKYINFDFFANTPEGGFGTVQSFGASNGYFVLPGQIGLVARNQTSFVSGDAFDVELINNNVIYWTLSAVSTEVFTSGTVLQDRNGAITGTVGAYYSVLRNQPFAGTITAALAGVPFTSYTVVPNTSILVLGIASTSAITTLSVTYTHRGNQPSLGGSYYLSAQYVRPLSSYNVPFVFYDQASATAFLDPVTVSNDLAIANTIAWNQAPAPQAVCFIQVFDTDGDGVFSPTDIDNAIAGAIGVSYITDVVGVNQPNYMDKFLTYNINASDPFAKKEQLQYFGLASGSAIGDQITQGTLIYTATNTLQVYGASPAHGTRILVGSTTAQMQVTQYDGSVVTVTLDGSFIASAIAALVAGLPNNSTDILRMNVSGFSYMETFNDTQNDLLGGASILWFRPNGANLYQIMEDVTVDLTSGVGSDYQLILAMKTKQDSVKQMREQLDRQLVGQVADTLAAGIGFVSSAIMSELLSQVGSGVIAPYQDASGNARSVSPSDIQVIQDASDPTLYHFRYLIFTKTPIKRLYGTYSVNQSQLVGSL